MICVETDENQHKKYIKYDENIRYDNLFMDFSGKYIFIKYNPDKLIDKYNMSNTFYFFQKRMDLLENNIEKTYTHNSKPFKYIYLKFTLYSIMKIDINIIIF